MTYHFISPFYSLWLLVLLAIKLNAVPSHVAHLSPNSWGALRKCDILLTFGLDSSISLAGFSVWEPGLRSSEGDQGRKG